VRPPHRDSRVASAERREGAATPKHGRVVARSKVSQREGGGRTDASAAAARGRRALARKSLRAGGFDCSRLRGGLGRDAFAVRFPADRRVRLPCGRRGGTHRFTKPWAADMPAPPPWTFRRAALAGFAPDGAPMFN